REYDALDRVLSITASGQTLARFCYDGQAASSSGCTGSPTVKGVLTGVWSPASATSYAPDVLGRITASTQTTDGVAYGFGYQYNVDGSLKTLTYPSGRTVTYSFDQAGAGERGGRLRLQRRLRPAGSDCASGAGQRGSGDLDL
ncbi:MAG: hypothetical protein AAB225_13340, partial [Acidobacteriota bacterium]